MHVTASEANLPVQLQRRWIESSKNRIALMETTCTARGMRILAVGEARRNTLAILERAERIGCASYPVSGIVEAEVVLKTFRFDVVLAEEGLPDGRGYDLTDAVAQAGTSLFVAVTLSESMLWLPVVDLGEKSLGNRALNQAALEEEIEIILCFEDRRTPRPASSLRVGTLTLV